MQKQVNDLRVPVSDASTLLDDGAFIQKMYSEVGWSYFGSGTELLAILNLDWHRLLPGEDHSAFHVKDDYAANRIYFIARCLCLCGDDLYTSTLGFLYEETVLRDVGGEGPQSIEERLEYLDDAQLAWTARLPKEVVDVLVTDIDSSPMAHYLASLFDPDAFIQNIKNVRLRNAFAKYWQEHRQYYV